MGLDFVTRCTPSYRRSWEIGRSDLLEPDLFRRHPQLEGRTYRLCPADGQRVTAGDELLLCWHGGELLAFRGHDRLGAVANPPAALTTAVEQTGGVVSARVENVHPRSGAADISIIP